MAKVTTANTVSTIDSVLYEEGVNWEDLHSPNPVERLCSIPGVNWEFNSRRYPIGGALFIQQGLLTLDWDGDGEDKEGMKNDILHYLSQDVQWHPGHTWEIQETGHGYHAVLLTPCEVPENLLPEWALALGVDMEYIRLRKAGFFDWRVTPKTIGEDDIVSVPLMRLGTAPVSSEVEEVLEAYYAAVEWCKERLGEDSEFLQPDVEYVALEETPIDFQNWVEEETWGLAFEDVAVFRDPFIGNRIYEAQVYKTKADWNEDWWSRVPWREDL